MSEPAPETYPDRLRGAAAMKLHLTLAAGLLICLAAGAYELSRALGGNVLSWAYVFEWPLFGIFGIYLWWRLLHEDAEQSIRSGKAAPPMTEEEIDRLEAWNAYLAELHASEEGGPTPPSA